MSRFFKDVGRRLHLFSHEAQIAETESHHDKSMVTNHHHDKAVTETNNHHEKHHKHHSLFHFHHHHHHQKRSDDDEDEAVGAAGGKTPLPQAQLDEYMQIADASWNQLWAYIIMPDSDWKLETGKTIQEGIIHSLQTKDYGKIFKLQAEVEMDAKSLWEEMVLNINNAPSWNPTLLECNTIMVIDHSTDISQNIAAGIGSIVSSRDFVNLRHWGEKDGVYMSAGYGVTHPDCPPTKKHIRGVNGPGGWAFRPVPGDPNKSVFIWVMNTDIKGWIPQRLMDQAASTVLLDYVRYLREHVKQMKARTAV